MEGAFARSSPEGQCWHGWYRSIVDKFVVCAFYVSELVIAWGFFEVWYHQYLSHFPLMGRWVGHARQASQASVL